MTKYYVEFTSSGVGKFLGICYPETKEIASPNEKIVLPEGAYQYVVYSVEETVVDGEVQREFQKNAPCYIKGDFYDLARLEKDAKEIERAIETVKRCNFRGSVKTPDGFLPLHDNDVLINK